MGPAANATRVNDKASVSTHKSTKQNYLPRGALAPLCASADTQIDARIAEQRTDQLLARCASAVTSAAPWARRWRRPRPCGCATKPKAGCRAW